MSLTLEVYSSGSTLLLQDDYRNATGITFDGFYPGGLFGTAQFFVPRKPARLGLILPGMRVKIRNGNVIVWEGYVSSRALNTDATTSGVLYTCLGAWGYIADGTLIDKPWADTRISEDVFVPLTDGEVDKFTPDRLNRMMIIPKQGVACTSADYIYIGEYTAPTGQTVKRVNFSYDFQEGAQEWAAGLYNMTTLVKDWYVTASATTTVDLLMVTTYPQKIRFILESLAAQTGIGDGTIYLKITDMIVYTETGSINSTEIGKDIIPLLTGCSTAETGIGSNTLSLIPFVADNISAAETLSKAAGFGDSSYNSWAFWIDDSDKSPDDKPILYYAQQPALTSAEYYLRLDDANMQAPVSMVQDTSEVRNWITVKYKDIEGKDVILSPNDDATLKDTTSITAYGTRAEEIQLDTTSAALAANYGRRYLAARKDPQWTISGGLTVQGYIRNATGGNVPAANIRPGERVRIENFIEDISGTGLTFLITGTAYDDASQSCTMQVGRPNTLDVWLARITGGLK
jgi:hypothetical protein